MLHSHSSASLTINVLTASELKSVQHVGKQDPFLQFSLDFTNKDAFQKTFTHKNAGDNAVWNQQFNIAINGEPDLFVEVLDEESTVDEVIGFCAIPINQVVHAPGANFNGIFEIYSIKNETTGYIHLQLSANGFPNSEPANFSGAPIRGNSYVNEEHAARVKSTNRKATGVAVGGALLGGAFAIGAGLLGKKLYDDRQEQEEQERLEQEEAQRRQEEEERKRREEREQFDQERQRFEQEKSDFERRSQSSHHQEYEGGREEHHHRRRDSNSSDEGDARKWNPVGTYAAGDRVKYHGNVYVCLQGHTSNPTWAPNYAHSLWQTE